jgi:RimJ/RimL family protein N-acetyltransferase
MRAMRIEVPERVADGRVAVRAMRIDDAEPYAAAFADDPDLGRLLGMQSDPDEKTIRDWIERLPQRADEGASVQLSIADAVSDAFWGVIHLHSLDWQSRRCEVGFWVIPEQRHRGVGSRAVSLTVSWVFNNLDLLRVEMTTTPENAAVPALAKRLGFTHEGTLRARNIERERRVDILGFGLLREEWSSRVVSPR